MKAQHFLAQMLGFKKWSNLLNASDTELELAKLIFDNQDKISFEVWDMHIFDIESENDTILDPEARLQLFKHHLQHNQLSRFLVQDFRLNPNLPHVATRDPHQQISKVSSDAQITSLPLDKADRAEFIETANSVFEDVMQRMEPNNPEQTRKLWNVESYVDTLLTEDMLPISKDYALSLIDALLVHHVIELAVEADNMA